MRHLYILQNTANLHSKSGISYMNIGEWWLPDKIETGYILTTNVIFYVEMSIFQRKLNHKFLWDLDLNGYPDQTIGWCGSKQRKSYHIVECWLSLKETEKDVVFWQIKLTNIMKGLGKDEQNVEKLL